MHRILILLFCAIALQASAAPQRILYLYGDVAADGTVPSGSAEPFHQMRLNDSGPLGLSEWNAALEAAQFNVEEACDQDVQLNAETLSRLDVLVLASNQRPFSADEAAAVNEWVTQGGGLVAWSDSAFGGDHRKVGVANTVGRDSDNVITEQFGMHFLTDNGAGNYLIREYTEDHFINRNQRHEGIRFRGEGVSFVRTTPPARILAKAQDGGLGGRLTVNKIDGSFQPETDAALAIAEIGKGRVVGVFDRNLFWNAGAGSRLSHADNREFVQRIMLWAAGSADSSRIPESDKKRISQPNEPPTVKITQTKSKEGATIRFNATISDDDQDAIMPEIKWSQVRGPAPVIFENNNPNTTNPIIMLPAPGNYTIEALVTDGEFRISRRFRFTVPAE